MKKQEMNIDLAKYLLKKINGNPARYTDLSGGRSLFFHALYLPCYKEGGDHYFLRTIHLPESPDRTFVSLKDQSGHEVGCILKSIITDQAHHRILDTAASGRLADMIHLLNREMFHSGIFGQKDFFTAVTAMIDHQHLELSYVSAGHPRFFLIREGNITALPAHGKPGRNLPIPVLPEMRFSEGKCGLQTGDRLFFYTDGLTDILCPAGSSALPFDAMQSFLADMIKTDPEICISGLLSAVAEKLGKEDQDGTQCRGEHHFPDDITILGMEIEKKPEPAEKSFRPRDADDLNDTVLELYKEISAELEKRNFRTDEPAFRSVLAEGCINAWKHGNGQDSRKTIRIRWYPGNDLHLEITDEGEGFDYGKVSDPKSPENIIRSSGRGLFIIRHYSETLHWEDGGKRMVVTIKNQNNNRQGL